jgi:hypothetical protein
LRDILFFEAEEDADAHRWITPGVPAHWLADEKPSWLKQAPATFGAPCRSASRTAARKHVEIAFTAPAGTARAAMSYV